jgi:hypothetical protein
MDVRGGDLTKTNSASAKADGMDGETDDLTEVWRLPERQ